MLDDSARNFFEIINAETKYGEDVFTLSGELLQLEVNKAVEEGKDRDELRKEVTENTDSFPFMSLELMGLMIPPLYRKNKGGQRPREVASSQKNKEVYEVFDKYGAMLTPDLHSLERSHIWKQVSQTKLEDIPLAQGILQEDLQAFRKSMEELYSGSTRNLLTVLHSTTEEGNTIFHLVAKVQSHQEEFAKGIEELMEFSVPFGIRVSMMEEDVVDSNHENWQPEVTKGKKFRWLYGGAMVFLGGAASAGFFYSDYYVLGTGMLAVAGMGLRQCHSAFKENRLKRALKKVFLPKE